MNQISKNGLFAHLVGLQSIDVAYVTWISHSFLNARIDSSLRSMLRFMSCKWSACISNTWMREEIDSQTRSSSFVWRPRAGLHRNKCKNAQFVKNDLFQAESRIGKKQIIRIKFGNCRCYRCQHRIWILVCKVQEWDTEPSKVLEASRFVTSSLNDFLISK